VRQRRQELEREANSLSQQIEALRDQCVKEQVELDRLHEEGEALRWQQAIEHDRRELREHIDRWGALVLADKLLDEAIERFQREHQPAVLAAARTLLAQLTEGAHVDIRHATGESFWIVDRHGEERRPDQLSRGTQEQLYLAFRLAYVQHYCRDNEPLPLAMDDVLVNFDQRRAGQTLSALFEISRQMQILFLTCHEPTAALVKRQCPSCHVLELSRQREPAHA
jgi:uncharacterized protein YhaN